MESLRPIFDAYWAAHPDEQAGLQRLRTFLDAHAPAAYIDRKNFDGHATASALVLNDAGELLLIEHQFLRRWLQPGGHIDAADASARAAALREVEEEVGLPAARLTPFPSGDAGPVDLDSHDIPVSVKKGEAAHVHHDFRYAFRLTGPAELAARIEEVAGYRWVPLDRVEGDASLVRAAAKLRRML